MKSHSEEVIHRYLNHPDVQAMFRGKLHAGHLNYIHQRAQHPINQLFHHIQNHPAIQNYNGGSSAIAGSIRMGGSAGAAGFPMAGSLHLGENLKNHKEMYHFALNLSPMQFEILREIAVQLLGGKPSPMWGRMTEEEPLESDIQNYEHIYRMPNSHALAKMIESEYGYGRGAGFGKAFKHVARIGAKVYKGIRAGLGVVNRNKDLLLNLLPDQYKGEAEAFLETANRIDNAVNPIVDATIDAVKEGATHADKEKLKKIAEDKIKRVVEEKVPKGKEIVKLAEDIKESIQRPVYAQ